MHSLQGQMIKFDLLYCAQSSCVNFDSARQSKIEAKRPNEKDHSRLGKADEEDRFGKVAASQDSYNLIGLSIKALFAQIDGCDSSKGC